MGSAPWRQDERRLSDEGRLRLERLPVAVFEVDEFGSLSYVNAHWTEMLGYPDEHALGRRLEEFCRAGDEIPPSELPPDATLPFVRRDGTVLWADVAVARAPGGGITGSLNDVTARVALELEVEDLLAREHDTVVRLRGIERIKDEFMGVAAQKLRTPVAAIIGFARTLRRDDAELDDAARDELLEAVEEHAGGMLHLVNDLLATAHAPREAVESNADRFQLTVVVEDIRGSLVDDAARVRTALPDELPSIVSDRLRTQRILDILVRHALRHSGPRAGVEVGARAEGDDLVIWVRHVDGAADDHDRFVDLASHEDPPPGSSVEGMGAQLRLARGLIRSLGGSILVESRPGERSAFSVRLPGLEVESATDAQPAPRVVDLGAPVETLDVEGPSSSEPIPPGESPPHAAAHIMVVDDDEANVRLLERLLARTGYTNVKVVTDSREAVGVFQAFTPDLLLLDVHMPHLDGFDLLEQLQDHLPGGIPVPTLMVTGDLTPSVRRRGVVAGVEDFVFKPIEASEVLVRVALLLEARFG